MQHLSDALALYQDAGDRRGEAKTLNNLGRMQLYCGYHRDALEAYQKSLEIFREIGGAQNDPSIHQSIQRDSRGTPKGPGPDINK